MRGRSLFAFLREPRLLGLEVGSREYFQAQGSLIQSRPLLKYCYDTWYREMLEANHGQEFLAGEALELGSGGSLLSGFVPGLITSDVVEGVADRVIDGRHLPFEDGSLHAIFMTHTLHHIPDVSRFLREADRVLKPGGFVAMVEVAHTSLARLFFDRFHPEPYDDSAPDWAFPQADSMMDSNQALSWIIFERDRSRFALEFPRLRVETKKWLPWLTYLLGGGVTMRNLVPRFLAPFLIGLERLAVPLRPWLALHWLLILRKLPCQDPNLKVWPVEGECGQRPVRGS
jgi:SAM-dependent methyltransferase